MITTKTKKKLILNNQPEIKLSVWQGIIFNRSFEDVGEQRLSVQRSKSMYGNFMHEKGYMVYWTKYKFDHDYLPIGYVNHFLNI